MYIKQQLWNIPCEFYYGLKTWGEFSFLMHDATKNIVILTHWGLVMANGIGALVNIG